MDFLDQPWPLALAHRGGGAEVPENSRAALDHTVSLGYRYLETDLRATADGVVVLQHDATVDRTTDGTGPLSALTWAQVALLRDRSGLRPVRLDEALADFPGLRFNIDVKENRVVAPALRVVAEAGAWHRVCFASFSDLRLRVIRRAAGRVATSLGPAEVARLVLAAAAPPRLRAMASARVPVPDGTGVGRAVCVQVPERLGCLRIVRPAFVDLAHRLGLAVHVWTVDEASDMHRLLEAGVDGIVTDRPTVLRQVLRDRAQWDDRRGTAG